MFPHLRTTPGSPRLVPFVASHVTLEQDRTGERDTMEWLSTSWGYCPGGIGTIKDLIEQAKEELQILEDQEPNRFNYLKLDLKSFISHLESQNLLLCSSDAPSSINKVALASSVATQESSAGKKRKKVRSRNGPVGVGDGKKSAELPKHKLQKIPSSSGGDDGCGGKSRERIDVVVERARACLHKIQQLKISLS